MLEHPNDDVLSDYAIDPSLVDDAAAVEVHLAGCDPCSRRLAGIEAMEKLLADRDSWPAPEREATARIRKLLSAASARNLREDADADALLTKLIDEFLALVPRMLNVSATPGELELELSPSREG